MASTASPESDTLDLSSQGLKKLSRCPSDADISTLIVDDNELQRLDNLDSYHRITKLSVVRNQLLRMYGISKLQNLVTLNLSNNSILTIEGIKDMVHLQTLCLAGNNIKSIEHLHTNTKLEHLDLSENSISHTADISFLKNLKQLFLHNNRIITLRQCERYLPTSLETLTLANNNVTDLNEMSHLGNLVNLVNFSIANNPCVNMAGNSIGFDYRPFVINWCMGLKSIDGYPVDPIESLKAEWLYSQGRGRQFREGEHVQLAQYLASVCPLSGECLENETDKKLRLILSKAQHHQKQLNQQGDSAHCLSSIGMSPSPAARRRFSNNRNSSPRRPSSSRSSMRGHSPDRMVASCHTDSMVSSLHATLSNDHPHEQLMTQSLDPTILSNSLSNLSSRANNIPLPDVEEKSSPLQAATKLVPVPESLMSPDFRPPSGLSRIFSRTVPSKLSSPSQVTVPSKLSSDADGKSVPIINTTNPMAKTMVNSLKTSNLIKSSSTTNCHAGKVGIAKPIVTHANGKCPTSVKINNYVQNKALPVRKSARNSPNLGRGTPRSKTAVDKTKSSLKKVADVTVLSSDEDSEVCQAKLNSIRHRANQRRQEDTTKDDPTEKAAVCIQRMWRGYKTRNLNKKATDVIKTMEMTRTNKYIQKLSTDMEAARTALESEHKLQLLQMQAINALWKKVVTLQPGNVKDPDVDPDVVTNLTQTCNMLHNQVQQLQESMIEIKRCMSGMQQRPVLVDNGVGTQTEISAVHTPSGEENKFPYIRANRPQTLPIQTIQEGNESKNFATDGSGPKKMFQSTDTTDDEVNTDILNSNDNPDMFRSCDEFELKGVEGLLEGGAISSQVCEEELYKELHELIETENNEDHRAVETQTKLEENVK